MWRSPADVEGVIFGCVARGPAIRAAHGLKPLARLPTCVVVGDDPVVMLLWRVSRIGVFEVNEAFAPVPLAWLKGAGAGPARLNPRGGAMALGHPLGVTGGRPRASTPRHQREHGVAGATVVELLA
jgi:acetyl-CoA acyltransferase